MLKHSVSLCCLPDKVKSPRPGIPGFLQTVHPQTCPHPFLQHHVHIRPELLLSPQGHQWVPCHHLLGPTAQGQNQSLMHPVTCHPGLGPCVCRMTLTTRAGHHGRYIHRLNQNLRNFTEASENLWNVLDLFVRLFHILECPPLCLES